MCQALFVIPAPVLPKAQPVSPLPGPVPASTPAPSDSHVTLPGMGAAPSATAPSDSHPQLPGANATPSPPAAPSDSEAQFPGFNVPQTPGTPSDSRAGFPGIDVKPEPRPSKPPARKASKPAPKPKKPAAQKAFDVQDSELLHIPCPQCKKVLETPVEMLHQDVVCPHCQTPFSLHLRDSVEYRKKKERQQRVKERRTNYGWLFGGIAVVALVIIFLVYLIMSSPGE